MNTYSGLPNIGRGLDYNSTFNKISGGTNSVGGLELINQSIYIILTTPIGSRFFLPEFGSNLHKLVFEQNDFILHDLLNIYIRDALTKWEPRISVLSVEPMVKNLIDYPDVADNILPVNITYRLANSNMTGNYVYPFNRETYEIGNGGGDYATY